MNGLVKLKEQMAEKYSSTIDTTNFARIVRCILGPCTEMLRNILEVEVPPNEIKDRVRNVPNLRKNLTFPQKKRLCMVNDTFNMDPDYTKFDISLMYPLLRTKEICSNINAPSKSWGIPPSTDETSLGDDIERIRILKSDICSHASFPSINFPKYCLKMKELKDVALRFDKRLNKPLHFFGCICEIENMAMDAEIATLYTKLLFTIEGLQKEQNDGLLTIDEKVSDIQRQLEKLQTTTDFLSDVRPAACLYPERILARKDDIKIKSNYSYLLEQIDPMVILEQAYRKGIISRLMKEEISECNRRKQRTDRLLKSLLRSHPELYTAFIEVLNDPVVGCEHIVKKLESTNTNENKLNVTGCYQEMSIRLISNKRRICDEVNTDEIIHCFLEHEVLTLDEHSKVFYGQYRLTKIEILIEKILVYLPWSYQVFIESLGMHQHYTTLVKQLEETDVNQVQTGGSRLHVLGVEKTPKDSKIAYETDAVIILDVEANNAAQVHGEIVSKTTSLEATDVTAVLLHGIVANMGHGSIKITLTAASRLFWKKFKKLCDSEEIGDFIRDLIATEDVNLSLLPEYFTVHFKIHIPPHIEEENTKDTENTKVQSNLTDSYNFLQQEINCRVLVEDLLKAGVIDNKEILLRSEDPLKDLLQFLNVNGPSRLDRFIGVLQRAGYSYLATVLLESDVEFFDSISDDDIRIAIYDNYPMLLNELDFDQLIKASSLLRTRCTFILQKSDISRKNKIRLLLKEMVQGKSNGLRAFLKSLNYAGYQHILYILQETSKNISPFEDTFDDEGPVSKPIVLEGQIKMQKISDMSNLSDLDSSEFISISKEEKQRLDSVEKKEQKPLLLDISSGDVYNEAINISEDFDSDTESPGVMTQENENQLKQQKWKLAFDILDTVGKVVDGKKTQVIAVLGVPCSGKSSVISRIAAAFSGKRWNEYAYSGYYSGYVKPTTHYTMSFPKETYLDKLYMEYCMPTFIDIGPFQDEENEVLEEILRILFHGRLPEEQSLMDAIDYFKRYGIERLKSKYVENKDGLKVSRIIVVCSATDEKVPKNLINCIKKAARLPDSEKTMRERVIPIFGVMTKCDKVDFSDPDIRKIEATFIDALGITGSKDRYTKCEKYCDDADEKYEIDRTEARNLKIDLSILRFMKEISDPVYDSLGDEEKYEEAIKLETVAPTAQDNGSHNKEPQDRQPPTNQPANAGDQDLMTTYMLITYAVKGMLIALLLFWFFTPQIDSMDLRNTCVKHANYKTKLLGYHLSELDDICDRRNVITSRPLVPPLICFVMVMVGMDFYFPEILRRLGLQRNN